MKVLFACMFLAICITAIHAQEESGEVEKKIGVPQGVKDDLLVQIADLQSKIDEQSATIAASVCDKSTDGGQTVSSTVTKVLEQIKAAVENM